jgi:hypothetical protein
MSKKSFLLLMTAVVWMGLPSLGGDSLPTDTVLLSYPAGYTKLLVADLNFVMGQDLYKNQLLQPLRAARHPLNGIAQSVELFRLDPKTIPYVAHGFGPNLTSFSLIEGTSFPAIFGALQGLKAAVGAPNSPYTNWTLEPVQGVPVIYTGGLFGPVKIQWAYIPLPSRFLIGTETGFAGDANVARLKLSAEQIVARQFNQVPYFDEFPAAAAARVGQFTFVRKSDTAKDKPSEAGEEAMSFAIRIDGDKATITFYIRFQTAEQATQALARIQSGQSTYLAQDLYQAQLNHSLRNDRFVTLEVGTSLRGVVGLLVLAMPL